MTPAEKAAETYANEKRKWSYQYTDLGTAFLAGVAWRNEQVRELVEALELAKAQLIYLDDLFFNEGCDNSIVVESITKALAKFREGEK